MLATRPISPVRIERSTVAIETDCVCVSERDMRRLTTLLDTSLSYRYPRESARLAKVLEHAAVLDPGALPHGIVTMGARIFAEEDGEDPRELALVYPWDEDRFHGQISVLSAQGIALLGTRAGDTIDWTDDEGTPHTTRVLHVSSFSRED
jgi:transcription elongation GreA/GreB family factor